MQVGRAGGDVKVLHVTQHIYGAHAPPHGSHLPHHQPHSHHGHPAARDVHLVLALLDQVPDRIAVLDFMDREFGTRMVIELLPAQVFRVRRYAEVILSNSGPKT